MSWPGATPAATGPGTAVVRAARHGENGVLNRRSAVRSATTTEDADKRLLPQKITVGNAGPGLAAVAPGSVSVHAILRLVAGKAAFAPQPAGLGIAVLGLNLLLPRREVSAAYNPLGRS